MRKTFISGIAALLIAASMGAMAASAEKVGNVNQDDNIDIEDAVAVINHVNGVKSLSEFEELLADVDLSDNVDIEDAVRIINHINGITPLSENEVFANSAKAQIKFWYSPENYKKGKDADYIYYLYDENETDLPTVLTANEYNSDSFKPVVPEGKTFYGWIDKSTNNFVKGDITGDKELVACFTPISCNVNMYDSITDYNNNKVSKNITLFESNSMGLPTKLAYEDLSKIIPKAPNDDLEFDGWFRTDKYNSGLADKIYDDYAPGSDKQLDIFAGFKYKEGRKPELDEGEYWITIYNDSSEEMQLAFVDDGSIQKFFQEKPTKFNTPQGDKTEYMSKVRNIPAGGKSFSYGVYNSIGNKYEPGSKFTIYCTLNSDVMQIIEFDPYEICDENHCIELHINPGYRTKELFDQLADGNYFFEFSGDGVILDKETEIEATIRQVTKDMSRVHVKMPGRNMDSEIVIKDNKKYKIVDEVNKKYSANLSASEKLMDFNAIFSSIAKNKDTMKFIEETVDEENGLITEKYSAKITTPVNADITIEASYSTDNGSFRKLVMYTDDYLNDDETTTVYINTRMIEFDPEYENGTDDIPDFSTWEKVTG